jgi:alpha-beta hydrolase superfamily lysophospholipase
MRVDTLETLYFQCMLGVCIALIAAFKYLVCPYILRKRHVSIAVEPSSDPIFHQHASVLLGYKPGTLDRDMVIGLAATLSMSRCTDDLVWFANNAIFSKFLANDGTVLQAYQLRRPKQSDVSISSPAIVFSCGWTETILKYAHIIRRLYQQGAEIFAFDMRGQGFSQSTGWDEGRVTHVERFAEYPQDLTHFVEQVVRPIVGSNRLLVYIGNSLGGLVGYTAQNYYKKKFSVDENETREKGIGLLFNKVILVCPCIQPAATEAPIGHFLHALHLMIPTAISHFPLVRFSRITDPENVSHDMDLIEWWEGFKRKASRQLIVTGPSARWLHEVHQAGVLTYKQKSAIMDDTDVLVMSAGDDRLVSSEKIQCFFDFISTSSGESPMRAVYEVHNKLGAVKRETMLRISGSNAVRRHVEYQGGRHELWIEDSKIVNSMLLEVFEFIGIV